MNERMRLLVRPPNGTVVGGVAAAIAERFGLSVFLVRLVFLASMNASEVSIALYILLWLSIPNVRSVIGLLDFGSTTNDGSRIGENLSRAFAALGIHKGRRALGSAIPIGLAILLFAICLQFTKLSTADPFRTAPFIGVIAATLTRLSSAIFYASCGLLFLFRAIRAKSSQILTQEIRQSLQLDQSDRKALFGLVSGVGADLGVDAGLLRPLLILANILTLGGAGAVYLIEVVVLRQKKEVGALIPPETVDAAEATPRKNFTFSLIASRIIGVLFILLSLVRLATEYRFFFFNEAFAAGAVLCVIGVVTITCALGAVSYSSTARMLVLASTSILLYGLYELSTVLFYVQLPFVARFELSFAIAALSFIYYGFTALTGKRLQLALLIGTAFLLAALGFQFNLLSSRFVLAIVEFYLYFYPILYGTAGLWLIVGANGGKGFRYIPTWLEISERRTMNLQDQPLPQ